MHRPRSSRHWPIAVLLCGAVISGVLGTATQSDGRGTEVVASQHPDDVS